MVRFFKMLLLLGIIVAGFFLGAAKLGVMMIILAMIVSELDNIGQILSS